MSDKMIGLWESVEIALGALRSPDGSCKCDMDAGWICEACYITDVILRMKSVIEDLTDE